MRATIGHERVESVAIRCKRCVFCRRSHVRYGQAANLAARDRIGYKQRRWSQFAGNQKIGSVRFRVVAGIGLAALANLSTVDRLFLVGAWCSGSEGERLCKPW